MLKKIVLPVLLIIYFLFTSGFVFEVMGSTTTDRIDLPWSNGLSGERTGLVMVATQDDMNCINWLKVNWDGEHNILGDYNARCLVAAYIPVYLELFKGLRLAELGKRDYGDYIFITTWNTEHDSYIEPTGIGSRKAYKLPIFYWPVVYQSGKAIVYRKIDTK